MMIYKKQLAEELIANGHEDADSLKRGRKFIIFSEGYEKIYEGVGCETNLLSTYVELVFKRNQSPLSEKQKLNTMYKRKNNITKNMEKIGFYLIERSVIINNGLSVDYFLKNKTLTIHNESKGLLKLEIPRHKGVMCRLHKEEYYMYKHVLNEKELEVVLRMMVNHTSGAYYNFSHKTLYEIIKRYTDIDKDGVVVENSNSTINKRISRLIDKLKKAQLVKKYGDYYTNAPNEIEYMKCISETDDQWRKTITRDLRSAKAKIDKLENEKEVFLGFLKDKLLIAEYSKYTTKQKDKDIVLQKYDYSEYLKSKHWTKLSLSLREARGKCCICSSKDDLHVHHNNYKNLGDESEVEDVVVLCKKCHSKFHDK